MGYPTLCLYGEAYKSYSFVLQLTRHTWKEWLGLRVDLSLFFFLQKTETNNKKKEDLIAITQLFPRGLQILQTELPNLKSEDNIKWPQTMLSFTGRYLQLQWQI